MSLKNILKSPLTFLNSLLDRIFAVTGAIISAQFPQFISQYMQRLGGHVDEAAKNILKYKETARDVGKTLEQYIKYLTNSNDSVIVKTGEKILSDIERYKGLKNSLDELLASSAFNKFFIFIKNIDFEIAGKTYDNFTPGIPVNIEGILYALTGVIIGMIIYYCLKKVLKLLFKKLLGKKRKKSQEAYNQGIATNPDNRDY